MAAPHWNRKQE